jgi:hypothetical protein
MARKDVVSKQELSLMLRFQHDATLDATLLQVIRVDGGEAVPLKDGHFLLRITIHEKGTIRCLVRHLASGREVHLQSGARFVAFIQDCLLDVNDKP